MHPAWKWVKNNTRLWEMHLQQESVIMPLACNSLTKVTVSVKHVGVYFQDILFVNSFVPKKGWGDSDLTTALIWSWVHMFCVQLVPEGRMRHFASSSKNTSHPVLFKSPQLQEKLNLHRRLRYGQNLGVVDTFGHTSKNEIRLDSQKR